uniref:Uncharacterized protein n=1 Tax=Rhizophora mucronata TaxID=61149 RepID=A0A2P2QTL4_RHIMU
MWVFLHSNKGHSCIRMHTIFCSF